MSSSLPTALIELEHQRPSSPSASSSTSSSSDESSIASLSELESAESDSSLVRFYKCISASLVSYCVRCCSGGSAEIGANRDRWRRQIRRLTERQFYRLLTRQPASGRLVARVFGSACARAIAETSDRLGGRGWTSERAARQLSLMISPILADLGLPAEVAGLNIQLPSFSSYSSKEKQSFSYAVRLPELVKLLRPFNDLVTLLWSLNDNVDQIVQPDVLTQFVALAASSARRAVAQFPVQFMDCLAGLAVSGFTRLAGTPMRHRQVQLCTKGYLADTLWPRYCQLLIRLASEHMADWVSVQLNKRLQTANVELMVAEAQTRLKWYTLDVRQARDDQSERRSSSRPSQRLSRDRKSLGKRQLGDRNSRGTRSSNWRQPSMRHRAGRRFERASSPSPSDSEERFKRRVSRSRLGTRRDGSGGAVRDRRCRSRDRSRP